jgi:tRNA A-37 threonylcarbamoyl transferase component Bud32
LTQLTVPVTTPILLKQETWVTVRREPVSGIDALVKTYRVPGWLRWRTWFARARAERELRNLQALRAAGVPCPEPLGCSAERRFGWVRSSTIRMRFVPRTRTLRELLRDGTWHALPPATRRTLLTELGANLRRLHGRGLLWTTTTSRNVLVQQDPEPHLLLCDVPYLPSFGRDLSDSTWAGVDLYDAAFSPARQRELTARERVLLLRGYAPEADLRRRIRRRFAERRRSTHRLHKALARLCGRRPD